MSALRTAGVRRLWLAGLVSDTGDWLLLVSLPIVVYGYTGSTLGTAAAFLLELAPPVLLAPLAARLADRADRRRTLALVSLAQAVALLPLLLVHDRSALPVLYAVIAVESALAALFVPTEHALVPTLVDSDRLVPANSVLALGENLGRLVGGPLGGLLLGLAGGLTAVAAVDAASFLIAFALIAGLPAGQARGGAGPARGGAGEAHDAPGRGGRRRRGRRRGGTRSAALASRPVRGALLAMFAASAAQGIFVVLFVVFVARSLHGGAAEIGLLRGVQAIGSIAAAALLALRAPAGPGRLAAGAAAGFGLLCLAIWNAPQLTTAEPLYVALFAAVGAPGVAMVTGLVSALQEHAPESRRGAVFAALGVAASAGEALGMLAGGLLGDTVGVVAMLDVQGALYLLAALVAARTLAAATSQHDVGGNPHPAMAASRMGAADGRWETAARAP